MFWTTIKVVGAVALTILSLFFVLLLIMVTRPALLVGVSNSNLARSLSDATGSAEATCRKRSDGDWLCERFGPGKSRRYLVDVDWMGCWSAKTRSPSASRPKAKGCIQLGDLIDLNGS